MTPCGCAPLPAPGGRRKSGPLGRRPSPATRDVAPAPRPPAQPSARCKFPWARWRAGRRAGIGRRAGSPRESRRGPEAAAVGPDRPGVPRAPGPLLGASRSSSLSASAVPVPGPSRASRVPRCQQPRWRPCRPQSPGRDVGLQAPARARQAGAEPGPRTARGERRGAAGLRPGAAVRLGAPAFGSPRSPAVTRP